MSSGGGKGGKKTQETTIPEWLRGPAERNLQRAEAVQQIEYMPYYGPDVAAFTPAQNAAFDANIGAAEAFGLLAPNTLTATSGMPTPEEFAGGFKGYSSQGLYDQALAELKAKQPGAVAQYNALFGNAVPAPVYPSSDGGRFRGSAGGGNPPSRSRSPQPHYLDSGLDDLNDLSKFPIPTPAEDPFYQRNVDKQKANANPIPWSQPNKGKKVEVTGKGGFFDKKGKSVSQFGGL
ncbi:MAG: hypothetical protein QF535_07185 [Anaerolineales bacterium]|nr:hypothetical protein [Anaerolineales bacterium]